VHAFLKEIQKSIDARTRDVNRLETTWTRIDALLADVASTVSICYQCPHCILQSLRDDPENAVRVEEYREKLRIYSRRATSVKALNEGTLARTKYLVFVWERFLEAVKGACNIYDVAAIREPLKLHDQIQELQIGLAEEEADFSRTSMELRTLIHGHGHRSGHGYAKNAGPVFGVKEGSREVLVDGRKGQPNSSYCYSHVL
jgi:hypothetical protein